MEFTNNCDWRNSLCVEGQVLFITIIYESRGLVMEVSMKFNINCDRCNVIRRLYAEMRLRVHRRSQKCLWNLQGCKFYTQVWVRFSPQNQINIYNIYIFLRQQFDDALAPHVLLIPCASTTRWVSIIVSQTLNWTDK